MPIKKKDSFSFEVLDVYGQVRGEKDSWGITVTRMKWDDNPPTINVRSTNLMAGIAGKGVSLTDAEADSVVDILLNNDFGSIDAIESALERRRSRTEYNELQSDNGIIDVDFEVLDE